jgi:D-cysteine desulfhydrase
LEFLLADAQAQGCDTLLTAGAAQSNHCRLTAAVGAIYGLPTHLCLRGPEPQPHTGNLILDDWLGAILHFAEPGENVTDLLQQRTALLRQEGKKPYPIPIGGSNAVGATGYVAAMQELMGQGVVPDYIVVATGSGGTQAGLEVGVRLAGLPTKILGVGVANPDTTSWEADISHLANQILARFGSPLHITPQEIHCPMNWMGEQYGKPTPAGQEALRLLARTEGIFLDSVYSAKAFSALLEWCQTSRFAPTDTVLFWHTGGTPSLFA